MGIKRVFDIALSLSALVFLLIPLLVVCCIVRVKLGSPAVFSQVRQGEGGRPFTIFKFRTMTEERDDKGELLPDELRTTSFGSMLRKTSIDELPELWNILVGDMSFVGPRPLLMEYSELYSEAQRKRFLVKPGLTGWAQVNGRNGVDWQTRLGLDSWYAENQSFRLDLNIMWRTVFVLLKPQHINADDGGSMPKFTGNQDSDI